MVQKIFYQAAIVGSALLGLCGNAYATATQTIDGITFPVGLVANGNQIQGAVLDETLIHAVGDTLRGVGLVGSISTPSLAATWNSGDNNLELAFVIDNYKATNVSFPSNITFGGGTVSYYVLAKGTAITGYGSVDADIAAIKQGQLFLQLAGAPENASGDTLISSIAIGTSLDAFTNASGLGYLDVTGGDAAAAFATRTFVNPSEATGFSDISLTSSFRAFSVAPEFGVFGSATAYANSIPEPFSLAVMGVGLAAIGAVRRRS